MKFYYFPVLLFIVGLLILNSCGEELSPETKAILFQKGGCQNNTLRESNYSKRDSCFSYSFTDKLTIEFCVFGNCCPEENRFLLAHRFVKDSIIIAVKDTAQNLCRCVCNYIIHAEFESPALNRYYVKCILTGAEQQNILYSEIVNRNM